MDDHDLADVIDNTTAEGYMVVDRRLSEENTRRLSRADWRGEGDYYLPEHLEGVCEPNGEDPGTRTPIIDKADLVLLQGQPTAPTIRVKVALPKNTKTTRQGVRGLGGNGR